jgi:hypothetical protein
VDALSESQSSDLEVASDSSEAKDSGPQSDVEAVADSGASSPPDEGGNAEIVNAAETSSPSQPLKVLFLGNSYTYFHDLPQIVADLSAEAGAPITVDSITQGGAWLQHHAANPSTLEAIETGGWSHVVLQEQSVIPVTASGTFIFAAADLSQVIHEADAVPVFFETWARAEGNVLYESDLAGYTPATMQEELRFRYQLAATNNDGIYAPVGDAWEVSLAEHPKITLYSADGSHPLITGSFLAACVFYEILTGKNVVETNWKPEAISDEDASALRSVAHQTVSAL